MVNATHDKGELWAEPIYWAFGDVRVYIVTRSIAFVEFDKKVSMQERESFRKDWRDAFSDIELVTLPDVEAW